MKNTNENLKTTFSIGKIICKLITIGYAVMLSVVIFICVFLNDIYYARKTETICSEWIILLGGIFVIIMLAIGLKYIDNKWFVDFKWEKKIFFIISVLLMAFQCYSVWCYYFSTGWDVATVLSAAKAVAYDESLEEFYDYFSMYPNNLFLV